MTIMGIPVEAVGARKARYRRAMAEVDYRRNVVLLRNRGVSQTEIAAMIGVAQPTVQKLLARAEAISMPRQGFSGADPYEICQRYAADLISREQVRDELSRWEYTPRARTADPVDDLIVDTPGSIADVKHAMRQGLIDEDLFYEIVEAVEMRGESPC